MSEEESANVVYFLFRNLSHSFDQKEFDSSFHLHFLVDLSDFLGFVLKKTTKIGLFSI